MKEIAGIAFSEGEKLRSTIAVDGTDYVLPVTVICGREEGKTVLLTAGIHSCEYVGIETLRQLSDQIRPEDISGTLIIIPVVNRSGFENRLPTLVPEDGKNLNRVFPGKPKGTASERLAYFISSRIFPHIEFYVDLHSGGIYEDLDHYVYFVGACDPEVSEYAKGAARLCHVPYMVKSFATTGCYNYAGREGIPSLLLERGGCGRWTQKEVDEDRTDLANILRYVGIFSGNPVTTGPEPMLLEQPLYITVSHSGFWYTDLEAGGQIRIGQQLGYITDYEGRVLERVYAEHEGRVLYITKTLWADKDTEVVTYAKLCGGEECHEENHHHHIHEEPSHVDVTHVGAHGHDHIHAPEKIAINVSGYGHGEGQHPAHHHTHQ